MNPNPSIIVVSLVTRAIVSRTTWADWAIDNGECVSLTECERLANELRAKGCVEVNDHLLIDATPDDALIRETLHERCRQTGIKGIDLHVVAGVQREKYLHDFLAGVGSNVQGAHTMDEAIAKVRANILSPKDLAEKKRAQAETLLREADDLYKDEQSAA